MQDIQNQTDSAVIANATTQPKKPRARNSKVASQEPAKKVDTPTSTISEMPTAPAVPIVAQTAIAPPISNPIHHAKQGVNKTMDAGKAKIDSMRTSATNVFDGMKNAMLGAMLVFLAGLPQFFTPIQFVISNIKTLSFAALHVLGPISLGWYVAQTSPLLRDSLFSDPSIWMKVIGLSSLYSLSLFTWFLSWMFAKTLFSGISAQINSFAEIGQKQASKV